jgi:hypothetical protein
MFLSSVEGCFSAPAIFITAVAHGLGHVWMAPDL